MIDSTLATSTQPPAFERTAETLLSFRVSHAVKLPGLPTSFDWQPSSAAAAFPSPLALADGHAPSPGVTASREATQVSASDSTPAAKPAQASPALLRPVAAFALAFERQSPTTGTELAFAFI